MRQFRLAPAIGMMVAAAVIIAGTTGAALAPTEPPAEGVSVTTEFTDPGTGIVTLDIPDSTGYEGTAEVEVADSLPEVVTVDVTADDGQRLEDSVVVESIAVLSADAFVATVRSESTGETIEIDTTQVQQQIIPAIIAALVVSGIKAALKIGTKAAIKEAAKKAVLALDSNKWSHIMAAKHNWSRLANSKEKIADLIADTVANGTRTTAREHVQFTWHHQGQTIVVRTSLGGEISNGWIE